MGLVCRTSPVGVVLPDAALIAAGVTAVKKLRMLVLNAVLPLDDDAMADTGLAAPLGNVFNDDKKLDASELGANPPCPGSENGSELDVSVDGVVGLNGTPTTVYAPAPKMGVAQSSCRVSS